MIDCGLLSGDPLAYLAWSREQRVAALSWWIARRGGAESAWAHVGPDLTRWLDDTLARFVGLREFVVSGIARLARGR